MPNAQCPMPNAQDSKPDIKWEDIADKSSYQRLISTRGVRSCHEPITSLPQQHYEPVRDRIFGVCRSIPQYRQVNCFEHHPKSDRFQRGFAASPPQGKQLGQ
ncbi:hypothetical protein [Anabaena azotica]|uniref:hypothetical protein n=1 Tax=Anabaena azotica TaxID=197653 RepID=UPI0039A6A074